MARIILLAAAVFALGGCQGDRREPNVGLTAAAQQVQVMAARFAPVDVSANIFGLPPNERRALAKLVEAATVLDAIFLRQVWAGNGSMLTDLQRDGTDVGRARLHYFLINKGPWSRVDEHQPFMPGVPLKPLQANFYPIDATKEDLESWLSTLSPAERAAATGYYTTIRRGTKAGFVVTPYSLEYQGELALVGSLLR